MNTLGQHTHKLGQCKSQDVPVRVRTTGHVVSAFLSQIQESEEEDP